MALEDDLTGEQDPEERLALHEQLASDADQHDETPVEAEHDGNVVTEDFAVSTALSRLSDGGAE